MAGIAVTVDLPRAILFVVEKVVLGSEASAIALVAGMKDSWKDP